MKTVTLKQWDDGADFCRRAESSPNPRAACERRAKSVAKINPSLKCTYGALTERHERKRESVTKDIAEGIDILDTGIPQFIQKEVEGASMSWKRPR